MPASAGRRPDETPPAVNRQGGRGATSLRHLVRVGPRSRAGRAASAVLVGLGITLTGALAGVATTAALPTTVTTRQYSATVRLTTDPGLRSTVHAPTVFGDLDASFEGLPAPGIETNLQVRDSISSVLASSGIDIRKLQPSSDELDAAIRAAVVGVGLRVLLGIALVSLAAWLLLRTLPLPWSPWIAALSGLLAVLLVAAPMALDYQRDRLESVRTTGLLSLVRANRGLLSSVEKRAAEATPYVRNMLALAAALNERYTPSTIDSGSLRIVAVSDIHGANQYPLLKSLVEQENAHAVIDTGDLVNFGSVQEAQAAGIFTGIASLGVPYLFVRGNHDANSPTDDALVQRLRTIPNVIVLEPEREKTYTLASVGGLLVGGFGDPRWFGDGGQNTAEAQKPAIAAFQAALSALHDGSATTDYSGDTSRPLDLLLGHEPSSVQGLAGLARIRLNGHLHAQSLDGSRIALGSFSGGGVVSHYIESSDGSELAGQPYEFDVLAFGSDCSLANLTRYSFTHLLEGRPTFDNVQVVNGAAIAPPVDQPGRTCSRLEPTRTWTFSAPSSTQPSQTPSPSVTPSLPSGSPTPTVTETRPATDEPTASATP